jgi:rhamnosyltransferase
MKVSVVIPTRNGGPLFTRVLSAIFVQDCPWPFEVICVDSGSTDGTPDVAARAGARVISIDPCSFNHGLTRNLGIEQAEGDFAVLTVQDALPRDEHWLAPLVAALAADDRAAGSYSMQIPRPDCDPIIRDRLEHWSAGRPERRVQEVPLDRDFDDLEPMEKLHLISFDNVSSCIRRSVWERYPFARRNFGEDVAWSREVIPRGYRIVYEPASAVIHSHNNSLWYEFRRIYADHQNLNQLVGLRTVPRFRDIFTNAAGAFRHYRTLIGQCGAPMPRRWYRTARALPHAYLENLAQFLGARLHGLVNRKVGIAISLDNWFKQGV